MIIAIDVHYRENFAKVISVEFDNWKDSKPSIIHEVLITEVEEYIPGKFYKRELPCILEVLKKTPRDQIELIIVDGYVTLDDSGKHGLGGYLYEALNQDFPVIGVAKRSFINNKKHVVEILRGNSQNPLYITSIGIDLKKAAQNIQTMAGKYRLPDLLRILDQKTKA